MNWVGGSRSRVMKSSDTKKQKEFFEKKRMQNRHNLLAPPPATPKKGNAGNMDLLTMFIVNQIALKKEHAGDHKHKKTHLPKSKGTDKSMGGQSIELPMSPCSPSRLNLAESKSHYREQTLGLKRRKHSLLHEFKFKTLSPLPETNLSDTSTSLCQHRVQGSVGSISSASLSSSEAFNVQSRPTVHISPLAPTELYSTRTAQPVGVCECNPWTVLYQTEAPQTRFADGVQSGSILHSSECSGPSIYSAENPFIDLEMNDQEENPQFFGVNSGLEGRVHRIVSEHACELPVTCAGREVYATTNDATYSAPYILEEGKNLDGHNYMCHSNDILTTSQTTRVMSFNQKVLCNREHRERESKAYGISKTLRRINHKQDCEDDQFVPSCLLTNTQSGKTPRTQDKATQTAHFSSLTSKDASVQCCLLKAARMSIFTKPTNDIHHSRTQKAHATRRQTCQSSENPDHNQFALTEIPKVGWNTSWLMKKREPTKQGHEIIKGHESLSNSTSQASMKIHPLLHSSHISAPELKEKPSENKVFRGERCEGHEEECVNENPTVNSSCTEEHNAFTAETGGDRVSEGKGNLTEIADILLMLKHKIKQPHKCE